MQQGERRHTSTMVAYRGGVGAGEWHDRNQVVKGEV